MTDVADPRPALDRLGIPHVTDVEPTYGYDGAYTPQVLYGHWTASAAGSNTCPSVLAARSYHAAVDRAGVCHLGGYRRRQGHGGWGRAEPINVARSGGMTVVQVYYWQSSNAADDTSSMPNEYGLAVALDNNGTGEVPPADQYASFVGTLAAFAYVLELTAGHVLDHSSSTNRKVDIEAVVPELDPNRWLPDIAYGIAELSDGHPPADQEDDDMWTYLVDDEGGHLMASNKMWVRWLRTEFDNEHFRAGLERLGLPTVPMLVSREAIRLGEHGQWVGPLPPW